MILRRTTLLVVWFTGFYALVATGWILFSDRLLFALHPKTAQINEWQTLKGVLIFVAVTTGLLAVVVSIFLKKKEELKALVSEMGYLRAALDEHAIVSIADPQGKITYVNDKFCAISKYAREELLGQDHRIINSGHHPKEFMRELWTTIARGRAWHGEVKNKTKDGSIYWVKATIMPFLNELGRPTQYFSIRTEVTESKRTEETLATERTLLRTVFNLLPDIIYIKDELGRFLACNDCCARCMGAGSPQEMLGKTDADFFPAELATRLRADELTVLAGTPLIDHEESFVFPDGQSRCLLTTKLPRRDSNGKIIGIVGTGRDITERKLLEKQCLRDQRLEAVGTLAAGVAHDLNNILAPMLMAAELLKDKLVDRHDRDILAMIENGAQRGASVIRQLLSFSRGYDGARVSVQLRHLVREMAQLMNEAFPRNIAIESKAPADLWTVVADATQLHQVMMNLCVNGRDAMPDGGKLTLEVGNMELSEAETRAHPPAKPGPYVVIIVADTGHGIPPAIIERIFDPFFTTKGIGKGTGLGLSTVVGIVKSHGGFLTVCSEPGHGTSFRVYLPASRESADGQAGLSTAPEPAGHDELILVVDDEESICEAMRYTLMNQGYRVLTARNGGEAIRLFSQHRGAVRLVVTDIMMPVMDGVELIRALPILCPGVRIVVCSGLDLEDRRAELTAIGVTEILGKPFAPSLLLKTTERALAAKS